MLNPYLLDDLSMHEDVAVKSSFLDAMKMLTTCIDGQYDMLWPISSIKERRSTFAIMTPTMKVDIPSHEWWDLVDKGGAHLVALAKCKLAQMCFSLSCKNNWRSYSFVHKKN